MVLVTITMTTFVSAQIYQGQWMVGGDAGFNSSKYGDIDETQSTTFDLNPDVGYFFINNLAGGLRFSLNSIKFEDEDEAESTYSLAPFLRYYFLPAAQKVNVFGEASYGVGSTGQGDKESFNLYAFRAGPSIFLTPNVGLEITLVYSSEGGDFYESIGGNDDRLNSFGLNVGFQIHLGRGGGASTNQ